MSLKRILTVICIAMSLTACGSMSTRERNTVIGGGIGAAAGAALTDGSVGGTLGGAVVGGVVGNQIKK